MVQNLVQELVLNQNGRSSSGPAERRSVEIYARPIGLLTVFPLTLTDATIDPVQYRPSVTQAHADMW